MLRSELEAASMVRAASSAVEAAPAMAVVVVVETAAAAAKGMRVETATAHPTEPACRAKEIGQIDLHSAIAAKAAFHPTRPVKIGARVVS